MSDKDSQTSSTGWRVARWPPLAWIETLIKLIALVISVVALLDSLAAGEFALPSGLRLAQLIVMTILSLGLVAAIFDRLAVREIVAMLFVIPNNLGHWGMVIALASKQGPGSSLVAFAALMLAGDLVKLVFLKLYDFRVRDTPRAVLYGLTLVYVVGYALLLILEFLR
jgi:hypothetical protein